MGPAALNRLADDDSEAADDLRDIIEAALTGQGASPESTWLIAVRDLDDGDILSLAREMLGQGQE